MSRFYGKALLVIEAQELKSGAMRFNTKAFIQSCSGPYDTRYYLDDDFYNEFYDGLPEGFGGNRMKDGDRVRVAVNFDIRYDIDYYGEMDCALYVNKFRVLRRQPYKAKR